MVPILTLRRFYALIDVYAGQASEVASTINKLAGVKSVSIVVGGYDDIIVVAEAPETLIATINSLKGVRNVKVCYVKG